MSTIRCQKCTEKEHRSVEIDMELWAQHQMDVHGAEIIDKVLYAINGSTESETNQLRIIHILERVPQARADPATLVLRYSQYFPLRLMGSDNHMHEYRIVYDSIRKAWQFPEFTEMHHAIKFARYLSNIQRVDRHVRSIMRPDLNESPRKAIHEIQAGFSRGYWYGKSHAIDV